MDSGVNKDLADRMRSKLQYTCFAILFFVGVLLLITVFVLRPLWVSIGSEDAKAAVASSSDGSNIIDFYGDSITAGACASNIGETDWASIVSNTLEYTKLNHAVSSASLADLTMRGALYTNVQIPESVSLALLGYNDMNYVGTDETALTTFQRNLYSVVARLSLPSVKLTTGTSRSITYKGSWEILNLGWGDTIKASNKNGSTATTKITGSVIYVDIIQYGGYDRSLNVVIDGEDKGTFEGSTFPTTEAGTTFAPYLLRFADLSNSVHTVVLTVGGTIGYAYINWVAGLDGNAPNYPKVYIGGVLSETDEGYLFPSYTPWIRGSDEAVIKFNNKIAEVCSILATDGLNVKYVDVNSGYNADTDMYDYRHPNDSGHRHIAERFLSAMR
jgi:lysophospholipase L1-like esterase